MSADRKPIRIAGLPRSCRSTCVFDFDKGVTQLHRERTEQVAATQAVAAFARLLQRGGGGGDPGRTDRLRGAFELVRGGGQCRDVALALFAHELGQ